MSMACIAPFMHTHGTLFKVPHRLAAQVSRNSHLPTAAVAGMPHAAVPVVHGWVGAPGMATSCSGFAGAATEGNPSSGQVQGGCEGASCAYGGVGQGVIKAEPAAAPKPFGDFVFTGHSVTAPAAAIGSCTADRQQPVITSQSITAPAAAIGCCTAGRQPPAVSQVKLEQELDVVQAVKQEEGSHQAAVFQANSAEIITRQEASSGVSSERAASGLSHPTGLESVSVVQGVKQEEQSVEVAQQLGAAAETEGDGNSAKGGHARTPVGVRVTGDSVPAMPCQLEHQDVVAASKKEEQGADGSMARGNSGCSSGHNIGAGMCMQTFSLPGLYGHNADDG